MNESELLKKLRTAQRAINAAIDQLTEDEGPKGQKIGVCRNCGLDLFQADDTVREIHRRCYNFLRSRVESGETSWDKLEEQGRVGPKGSPGRKRMTLQEHQDNLGKAIAAEVAEKYATDKKKRGKK